MLRRRQRLVPLRGVEGQARTWSLRDVCAALREAMDTVSEVKEIKHAYRAGIRARLGVDY